MKQASQLIAVVDDEPSTRRALERLLRVVGFDVEAFPSGDSFLRSLLVRTPACVILDLHIPGVSGFEVQERLGEAHVGFPVIVLTGHDSAANRERAMEGGAVDYLCKPVSEDVLLGTIHRCLRGDPDLWRTRRGASHRDPTHGKRHSNVRLKSHRLSPEAHEPT